MNSKDNTLIEFSEVLGKLLRKVGRLDRDEKVCYGVTVSQSQIIDVLSSGELSMNQLSSELGLAVSTLTRVLDVLVRDKIVERNRSSKDRRKVFVKLSKEGYELSLKLKSCSVDYTALILNNIPEDRRGEVINSLKLLNDAIEIDKIQCCSNEQE